MSVQLLQPFRALRKDLLEVHPPGIAKGTGIVEISVNTCE